MKTLTLLLASAVALLSLSSCATNGGSSDPNLYLRSGSAVACTGLLIGVKPEKRTQLAVNLAATAEVLESLSVSSLPDPEALRQLLITALPHSADYTLIVNSVSAFYRSVWPQLQQGPPLASAALRQIALGLRDAAFPYLPPGR
jgi:hypothetical protein